MIPIPVMQLVNFFLSIIDNDNTLKINVQLKYQFTAHFKKTLRKLPFCTLINGTISTYTCNHIM